MSREFVAATHPSRAVRSVFLSASCARVELLSAPDSEGLTATSFAGGVPGGGCTSREVEGAGDSFTSGFDANGGEVSPPRAMRKTATAARHSISPTTATGGKLLPTAFCGGLLAARVRTSGSEAGGAGG